MSVCQSLWSVGLCSLSVLLVCLSVSQVYLSVWSVCVSGLSVSSVCPSFCSVRLFGVSVCMVYNSVLSVCLYILSVFLSVYRSGPSVSLICLSLWSVWSFFLPCLSFCLVFVGCLVCISVSFFGLSVCKAISLWDSSRYGLLVTCHSVWFFYLVCQSVLTFCIVCRSLSLISLSVSLYICLIGLSVGFSIL